MSANPSINTEAFTRREAQTEARDAATAAHFRHTPSAPTQADRLYAAADRMYAAALEVLEHYEKGEPIGWDDNGFPIYEPTVVPHGPMARLHAAARASGAFR